MEASHVEKVPERNNGVSVAVPGSCLESSLRYHDFKVLAVQPSSRRRRRSSVSLAWLKDRLPVKNAADLEHYLEGFRRAGLV